MGKLLYPLFFLSGACGLAYETLWAKYLALSLGHAAHAYAVVLAARGRGLGRDEFKDAAQYHGRFQYPLKRLYVAEWLRRFPKDESALWSSLRIDVDMGRLAEAREKLRLLLSRRLALESRSFLGQEGP